MRKLMLNLEALHVETFEVVAARRTLRGTVKGAESEEETDSCTLETLESCTDCGVTLPDYLSCACVTWICASRVYACLNTTGTGG
jgi:hypothetical protein